MKSEIREMQDVNDFKKIYKVFSGPPYNEKYTEDELEEIFKEYEEKGFIFGAYTDDGCVGLVALEVGKKAEHPVNFSDEEVMYLSDIAVLDRYRRTGLGTQLMIYGIMAAYSMGYSRMYMRTLEKGKSMSYGIANKVGFEQIPNAYQIIARERIDGSMQAATNIFLDIDLKNLDKEKIKKEIEKSATAYKKVEDVLLER